MNCNYCSYEPSTESELETHMLLRHPDEVEDSSVYESQLDDGLLDPEVRAEDGEAFGYE